MKPAPHTSPAAIALRLEACSISTPAGIFRAWFTAQGLSRLSFPDKPSRTFLSELPNGSLPRQGISSGVSDDTSAWLAQTELWLREYFQSGKSPLAQMPPCDLSSGSPFQKKVWKALQTIPCGQTVTYGTLAEWIGHPRSARAVGQACGANPVALLVPCHRVVAHHGALGGFSGGLVWKRFLLQLETGMRGIEPLALAPALAGPVSQ